MIDKTTLLTDLLYLEEGMVTPRLGSPWGSPPEGDHIRQALSEMDVETSRIAKRKFRKLHRKLRKLHRQEINKLHTRSGFSQCRGTTAPDQRSRHAFVNEKLKQLENIYGEEGNRPTVGQARARRRNVFTMLKRKILED